MNLEQPHLGHKQNSECESGTEQYHSTDQQKADGGVTVSQKGHRNTNRGQEHHVVYADTNEARIIKCRYGDLARLKS